MKTVEFKRHVLQRTAPPKVIKAGLRAAMRTSRTAHVVHALLGYNAEVGAMLQIMSPYLLGQQLKSPMLIELRARMGEAMFYLVLGARYVGAKVPAFAKKVKLRQTPSVTLLQLQGAAVEMLDVYRLTPRGQPLDISRLKLAIETSLMLMYGLSTQLYGKAPEFLIDEYITRVGTTPLVPPSAEGEPATLPKVKKAPPEGLAKAKAAKAGAKVPLKLEPHQKAAKKKGKEKPAEQPAEQIAPPLQDSNEQPPVNAAPI